MLYFSFWVRKLFTGGILLNQKQPRDFNLFWHSSSTSVGAVEGKKSFTDGLELEF